VTAWLALLRHLEGAPRAEQVRTVNAFVNRWRYRTDPENWGARDHWATPLEFILRSGDCEDYAILKYHSLRRLGFAPEDLRLVVVQDTQREIAHAVLAVRLDDDVVVLDNLTDTVRSQRSIRHYAPYYSINETARWVHVGDRAATVPAARAPSPPARSPDEPPR
jgi:predicted transglutaminase-like cysteine proteinase